MTEIVRVQPKYLHHRLDVRYNSPSAVNARMAIASSGLKVRPVGQLLELVCGPFGSTLTSDEHCPHGEVLLVQPTNLSGELFSDDTSWRITKNDLVEKGLKLYTEGTLLFARVGIYPHTGVLPQGCGLVTISSSMIAGIPVKSIDTYYLASFFQSAIGYQLLLAAQKVTAQPTIGTSEIGATEVPVPQELVQKYIGDKVRQAERLRAWAEQLRSKIKRLVTTSAIENALSVVNKKSNWAPSIDLTSRLDPKYYGSQALAVFYAAADSGVLLRDLVVGICNGFEERVFFDNGITYITVSEVSSGRLDVSSAPKIHELTDIPSKARINNKCVLVVRTGSIGTAVKVDERDTNAVISSHLIKLEFENEAIAAAVASFLSSEGGKVLLHKISYGAVQPQIGQDELLALHIPQYIIDQAEKLLRLTTAYEDSIRLAKSLVLTAKDLVESLIDGLLTEQQLIDAQKALEADDNSLDRDILGRLTTKGLDSEGDPLFADLDQLYDLLAQCQQMDE